LGLDLAENQLYVFSEESASWQLFAGEGTVIGNMYTGSYSTGPIYYVDMNESGDYDEGEALDVGTQIGLTWSN